MLSYAGRIQLIKSVLFGVQVYWSQIFILPQKILKLIQSACRVFLWTGKSVTSKRALVAWEKITLPKAAGGLGVVDLNLWNKAAICKMYWKLYEKKDAAWIKWIHGYYIKDKDLRTMAIPQQCCWMIRKILEMRKYVRMEAMEGVQKVSISLLYKELMGEKQIVGWSKLITHNAAPAKYIFMSWLLMQNGLATCAYLQKIGVIVDKECCLCRQKDESVEHLFFECEFSGEVWERLTAWCRIDRGRKPWEEEKSHLMLQCRTKNGKQSMYRCVLSVAIYLVWKERNARRMKGKSTQVSEIIEQGKVVMAICGQNNSKIGRLLRR